MNGETEQIIVEYNKNMAFRKRMMKLSKDELIDTMLNMKAFIDEMVEELEGSE